MTTTTTTSTGSRSNPRPAGIDHETASRLAATEYERATAVLAALEPQHWAMPTPCSAWDVRAMAGHMLGMTQMAASMLETLRQQRAAARRQKQEGVPNIDALTAHQVDKNAHLAPEEVVEAMRRTGPKAATARRRTPGFVRRRLLPEPQLVGDVEEWWTLGFLLDEILTRDPFLHRIDIADATGVTLTPTAEHEGAIVAGVVREWAERYDGPYHLELTGPAGGHWQRGSAERTTMDAVEFCRQLSGRSPTTALTRTQLPF